MSEINPGLDLDKLRRPFPPEAICQRSGGGGKQLSYIQAHSVIHRLNANAGAWDFEVLRETQEGDLIKAYCRLTIPGLGRREHVGVQKIAPNGGEDLAKGAISDCLKKCATLFGIGLELYDKDYEAVPDPRKAAWYDFKRKSFDIGMGDMNDDAAEEWAFYALGIDSTGPGTLTAEQLIEATSLLPAAYAATKTGGNAS